MKKGILYGVSVGPGDPELMTVKAVNTIKKCPVISAPITRDKKTLALDIAKGGVNIRDKEILTLLFTMSSDKEVLEQNHKENAEKIIEYLKNGKDVALLNLGDISIFSTYIYLDRIIKSHGYDTKIIPGVTSFCATAAAFGESLTEKDKPLTIIPAGYVGVEQAMHIEGTKVLMKYPGKLSAAKDMLKSVGLYSKARMAVNCTMADEILYKDLDNTPEITSYFSTIITVGDK